MVNPRLLVVNRAFDQLVDFVVANGDRLIGPGHVIQELDLADLIGCDLEALEAREVFGRGGVFEEIGGCIVIGPLDGQPV